MNNIVEQAPLCVSIKRGCKILDCGPTHFYVLAAAGIIRLVKIGPRASRAFYEDIVAIAEGRRDVEIAALRKKKRTAGIQSPAPAPRNRRDNMVAVV